jgi:polar amino acid transport system ATP-binding protein
MRAADSLLGRCRTSRSTGPQAVRHERVLRGVRLEVDTARGRLPDRRSAAGKSTSRCINALEEIQAARSGLGGERVSGAASTSNALRKDVGSFPGFNLFPHMTVLRNVTLAPTKVWPPDGDGGGAGDEPAAAHRARGQGDRVPHRLSGGLATAGAIVRALAMEPQLLLLTSTSALDPELVARVLNIVRQLAVEGMTMVIATHEMGFAREVATKVASSMRVWCTRRARRPGLRRPAARARTRAFLRRDHGSRTALADRVALRPRRGAAGEPTQPWQPVDRGRRCGGCNVALGSAEQVADHELHLGLGMTSEPTGRQKRRSAVLVSHCALRLPSSRRWPGWRRSRCAGPPGA